LAGTARGGKGSGRLPEHEDGQRQENLAANAKAMQHMLGHSSTAMMLDVYAGLFGDDLDERFPPGWPLIGRFTTVTYALR